jgi:hypothetical protein
MVIFMFILGGLLLAAGGTFVFFPIAEFPKFWDANLGWLAIVLTVFGIFIVLGGVYFIYNMIKR